MFPVLAKVRRFLMFSAWPQRPGTATVLYRVKWNNQSSNVWYRLLWCTHVSQPPQSERANPLSIIAINNHWFCSFSNQPLSLHQFISTGSKITTSITSFPSTSLCNSRTGVGLRRTKWSENFTHISCPSECLRHRVEEEFNVNCIFNVSANTPAVGIQFSPNRSIDEAYSWNHKPDYSQNSWAKLKTTWLRQTLLTVISHPSPRPTKCRNPCENTNIDGVKPPVSTSQFCTCYYKPRSILQTNQIPQPGCLGLTTLTTSQTLFGCFIFQFPDAIGLKTKGQQHPEKSSLGRLGVHALL